MKEGIEMEDATITGKTVVIAKLELKSPLVIGSGQDEFADIEVMKDKKGDPFIPATSLTGVLRHYFEENISDKNNPNFECFWGTPKKTSNDEEEKEEFQSSFICRDLHTDPYTDDAKIRIRDGVKIDPRTQTALDKAKYDFEIIEKGAKFNLFWEVTLRKNNSKETYDRILASLIKALADGTIPIGAKTNSGFGKCKLTNLQIFDFDFSRKEDVLEWLKQDFKGGKSKLNAEPFQLLNDVFTIDAKFAIKNSIIIRAYSEKVDMPDATSLSSAGKFVLPGTSLKGTIRHRSLKILKTLCPADLLKVEIPERKIDELFGTAGKDKEPIKGRVRVEEKEINYIEPVLQNRIKIDRFTGGTIKTALFDSMPLWPKKDDSESVEVSIKIFDYKPWEAGLMMQVLKDLWCEDLAVGGEKSIGRGVLNGLYARIKWKDKELVITPSEKGLNFSDESAASELNDFAKKVREELVA
jgi:CRISPR/Cas system CSM-associated protein Csm3 (group 7 of RAMP superfamily)